jgi:hypothetical protein
MRVASSGLSGSPDAVRRALAEGEFEMFEMQAELLKRMSDMRRADAERQAENWRLARLAQAGQQGWLSRQGCWLLCQLGHVLVGWSIGRVVEWSIGRLVDWSLDHPTTRLPDYLTTRPLSAGSDQCGSSRITTVP